MRLFDLHCDTLTELLSQKQSLHTNSLSVSISKARQYQKWIQLFAVFIPDHIRGEQALFLFNRQYQLLQQEIEQNKTILSFCTAPNDLEACQYGVILTVEGGAVLNGCLENIEKLAALGVKVITLTWNGECELGFGQQYNRGLKPFGKTAIAQMERMGILVDVSHLSDKGFDDVASITSRPFIATHSNARAVCANRRNLTDQQAGEIIRRGGLIGINLHQPFLSQHTPTIDSILEHIEHFLSLGGEYSISIGTDFDGADVLPGLGDIEKLGLLYESLLKRNYNETLAQNIFFDNAYRFFLENIAKRQE